MLFHVDKSATVKSFHFNQLKLNKMKKISFSVALARYHVLSDHMRLVAPMWNSKHFTTVNANTGVGAVIIFILQTKK